MQKLSGALKIVSLVAGLLSFIPVLAPIMGPIAIGSALLASAIDLSIYAATGEGSLKTILIDVGLNLLPGVGKLARLGMNAMKGTKVALAFAGAGNRLRGGLTQLRNTAVPFLKRLVVRDPVDIATGDMLLAQTDVDLAGALPLQLHKFTSRPSGQAAGTARPGCPLWISGSKSTRRGCVSHPMTELSSPTQLRIRRGRSTRWRDRASLSAGLEPDTRSAIRSPAGSSISNRSEPPPHTLNLLVRRPRGPNPASPK